MYDIGKIDRCWEGPHSWASPRVMKGKELVENLLTRHEAAMRLHIGLRTLDRRLATGELNCYRLGEGPKAPVRISEAQLQQYLERQAPPSVQERAQKILLRA